MSNLIALGALVVSIISLVISYRTKKSQDRLIQREIEAHDRELHESHRANVIARIVKEDASSWAGRNTQWKLVIRNDGPADAHGVNLEFVEDQRLVPSSELAHKLPMAVMAPGEEVRLIASAAIGQPSKYDIILKWRDNEEREVRRILTL